MCSRFRLPGDHARRVVLSELGRPPLDRAGRRGLAGRRQLARLLYRRFVAGTPRRGRAGREQDRPVGRPQPPAQPQDRPGVGGLHLHVSRENAAGRAAELPGHRAPRRGGLQPPAGKPHRGPGAEELHPRIVARSDHHHQPRGGDHRVQPGRGADLRPLAREGAGHAAFRRALSALAQRRAPQPHRALPGSGRGLDARQARGSDGLAGQRRGVSTPRWP